MPLNFVVLIGSATPPGRTHTIATTLAALLHRDGNSADVLDLATVAFQAAHGGPLTDYDPSIASAVATLTAANGVIVTSPVYRATYAGVLKNFLDIVPIEALRDKPIGLAVLGATLHHYLGVDTALRAIWSWYGALALPTSVYLSNADFDDKKALTPRAQTELEGLAAGMLTLTAATSGKTFGPTPLAAARS